MPTSVDSLQIEINAKATSANDAIEKLIGKLDALSNSLGKINGSSLTGLANGVQKLAVGMQGFKGIGEKKFENLASGINKLGSIDAASINKAASSMTMLTKSFGTLNNISVSGGAKQISDLAKGISQLGYSSAQKAVENIPKLATAMKDLMTTLSGAPQVSQNLINMTNALANLARTGASSGRAATSLSKSLDTYTASTSRASKGSFSLAGAIGKLYATYWLLFRAFGKLGEAIDISSSLTEVQNVVDVTFGDMAYKVEDFAKTSIQQFGMSELSLKQYASQFQAMGTAMGINNKSIENANAFLKEQTNGYIGLSDSLSDVSLNLTKLTADMASFYNVEQKDVAEDLQSIFTGMTQPLRRYGLDLTQATLQEWAMKQGLDANIESMSQAEKTMLRYQYVLANTGTAQGDFARTANTWANQVRILKQNFEQLAAVVGGTLINALKPLVQAVNNVMQHVINFARTVSNALGKIFGWEIQISSGGVANDIVGSSGEIADNLGSGTANAEDQTDALKDAGKAAKKLRDYTLKIDELNIIRPEDVSSLDDAANALKPSGGGTGTGGLGGAGGGESQLVQTETIFDKFESEIDTLYELGNYIRDALIGAMESIDWDAVYEKARGFGKGLAEFLNGLLAYDGEGRTLFGTVGKTLANTLNTVIYAALEFAKEFDFYQFGVNLADGINRFFQNFDFSALAQTLNTWVDGIKETIKGFLDTITWESILQGGKDFLWELELDTVGIIIGAIVLKKWGTIILSGIGTAIATKISSSIIAALGAKEGTTIGAAILGWIGKGITGIGTKIGLLFEGLFSGLSISESLSGAFGGSASVIASVGTAIAGIASTVSGAFLAIFNFIDMLKNGFSWLNEVLMVLGTALAAVGAVILGAPALVAGVVAGIVAAVGTIVVVVKDNWNAIVEFFQGMPEKIGSAIDAVVQWFQSLPEKIGVVVDAIALWFDSLPEKIGYALGFATGKVVQFGLDIWNWVTTELPMIIENIVNWFVGIGEKIGAALSFAVEKVVEFGENVWNWVTVELPMIIEGIVRWWAELPTKIYDAIIGVIEKISEWKDNVISYLSGKIPEIIDSVVSFFSELPQRLVQVGKDAISGLWQGIQSAWEGLKSNISEFCSGFVDGFKDALDIHSPSKRMEEIGKFAKEGLFAPFYNMDDTSVITGFVDAIISLLQSSFGEGSDIFSGISTSLKATWKETSIWWQAEIQRWLNDDVKAWFNAEDWKVTYSTIKTALESTWDEILNWWRNAIYRWYNDDVKTWFTKEKWTFSGIKDGLTESFKQAIEACNQIIDKFISDTKDKLENMIEDLNSQMENISNMSVSTASMSVMAMSLDYGDIPQYATGGFPEDGLFFANRTELVGQFANGKTAVANNEMIVAGIEEAAYRGFARAYAENNREASLLEELIVAVREGKTIEIDGRELVEVVDQRRARNGYAF